MAHREAVATIKANGGPKVESLLSHLEKFKAEMCTAHDHFAKRDEAAFEALCVRKREEGKSHNLKASYMNTLLCDHENNMLQAMWVALGKPTDCVLCFDGILVLKRLLVRKRIKELELAIRRATHIRVKLKVKPMEEALTLPADWATEKVPELFYKDYVGLIKGKAEHRLGDIQDWAHANLTVLSSHGKATLAVRDLTTDVVEGYSEKSVIYRMHAPKDIYQSLDVDCVLRADGSGPEDKPLFTNLGKAIAATVRSMKVETRVKAQFLPYLDTPPVAPDILNTWGGFPVQRLSVQGLIPDFTQTLTYKHFRDHFFAEKGEWEHWLDHVADIVQMPGRMPTNCAHLYVSVPGVGKEFTAQLMGRLLGTSNVCKIANMSLYFENHFNSQYTSKLVKIFEELPDDGLACKHHDQLKNDVEMKKELVHAKNEKP